MPRLNLTCRVTGKPFTVSEWEQEQLKKYEAPLPTLAPIVRHQRRMAHRNERKIYHDTCDLTGKPMISLFSPIKKNKVYSREAWHSDKWNPRDYGRDFDFNRPFFEQFYELQLAVPQLGLINISGENSDYCNLTVDNKNCYLVFGGDFNEDTLYSVFSMRCRDTADVYWVHNAELNYDSMDSENLYNVRYAQYAYACRDSSFLYECRNLENCFGCVGLVGKKYHIFNQPYSPEEYAKKIASFRLDTWSGVQKMKEEFARFKLQFPHRHALIQNSENCTGDNILNAKNAENCFSIFGPAEDLKDVYLAGWQLKDAFSSDHIGHKSELFYEMIGSAGGTHCAFCTFSWYSQDTFYCHMVSHSQDLFGCSNMYRAQYCILNKQYSKDDYFALRARIVEHMKATGEWGEFFPMNYSLFAYNETIAHECFPMSREAVNAAGLQWQEEELKTPHANDIPDSIHDVTDAICEKTFVCEKTGRPYKIIPAELALYRKMGVPVPHYAPETRNELRIAERLPLSTWSRTCAKCTKAIETSYAPERPEIIYCEACYMAERY